MNSEFVHCGDVDQSVAVDVPIYLETIDNWPATGYTTLDLTVQYAKPSDAALSVAVLAPTDLKEKGLGMYAWTVPALLLNEAGLFTYVISATGCNDFRGTVRAIAAAAEEAEQPVMVHAGRFDIGEIADAPVYLATADNLPATGLTSSNVTLTYAKDTHTAMSTRTPGAGEFIEKGDGFYQWLIPASLIDEEGLFVYAATPTAAGYTPYHGSFQVETPHDDIRACAVPAYLESSSRLVFIAWLEKNGQRIAAPTSARITLLKEGGGSTLVDATMGTPNADGVFTKVFTPITPDANTVYEAKIAIVYNGVTYTSIRGHTTFTVE